MTSVEQKLLSCATLLKLDARHLAQMQRLLPQIKDTDAFISLAMKEGLTGLLYKALLKSGLFKDLEDPQKQKLQAHYHQTVRLNLLRIHELKKILQQIARTDIQVVLLKGIALIHDLYQDVGLRPMDDIDLWAMPKDFKGLTDVLIHSGYVQDPLYPSTFRKGSTTLDLKTHLLGAERIKSRTWLLQQGHEQIFRRARALSIDGDQALVLDPFDQLIYLSLHVFKHNADKLIWLVDIRGLTTDWSPSDWWTLHARAKEMGQERTLFHVSFLLQQLLAYRHPLAHVRKQTGQDITILEKKILNLRIKKGALPEWAPLIFFSGKNDLKKQLVFILETLFPRPEILRQGFKDSPNLKVWQLYVMRFFQLAARAFTSLIKDP